MVHDAAPPYLYGIPWQQWLCWPDDRALRIAAITSSTLQGEDGMAVRLPQGFRRCPVCSGPVLDSLDDRGWVKCFQCGREFLAQEVDGSSTVATAPLDSAAQDEATVDPRQRLLRERKLPQR